MFIAVLTNPDDGEVMMGKGNTEKEALETAKDQLWLYVAEYMKDTKNADDVEAYVEQCEDWGVSFLGPEPRIPGKVPGFERPDFDLGWAS